MNGARRSRRQAIAVGVIVMLVAAAVPGLSPAAPARSSGTPAVEGTWRGSLQGLLRIVVHIERAADGHLAGTMDSPDQGATGLVLDTVTLAGDTLRFELQRIGGSYAGRIVAAGDSIAGQWSQAGMSLPLGFQRAEKSVAARRPQEPTKPYPYSEDTVRVANPSVGVSLAGTLTTPKGAGPFPCAVLVTGSGPEDRDETVFGHRPFLVLADHLTRQGIAVLRMDDRGVGRSGGRFAGATSQDFADDIRQAITFLKRRPAIDSKRIGLIGHSEGGLIAPIVAAKSSDVAFVVLMAGPGLPGDSILQLQSEALRRSMGIDEASIARGKDLNRDMYARIKAGDSLGAFRVVRDLIREQIGVLPGKDRAGAGNPDSIAAGIMRSTYTPWMRFFIAYDPRPTLSQVKCPVLAINGERDLQVPPKENLSAIEATLKAAGHKDFKLKELPGMNHLFQSCKSCTIGEYMELEETLSPVALNEISDWVTAHTTPKK